MLNAFIGWQLEGPPDESSPSAPNRTLVQEYAVPPLLPRLSSEKVEAAMVEKDYIDPKGYWACPEGGIKRLSDEGGEPEVIVKKAAGCSDAEWKLVCEALIFAKHGVRSDRTMPQFHVEHNRVVIS